MNGRPEQAEDQAAHPDPGFKRKVGALATAALTLTGCGAAKHINADPLPTPSETAVSCAAPTIHPGAKHNGGYTYGLSATPSNANADQFTVFVQLYPFRPNSSDVESPPISSSAPADATLEIDGLGKGASRYFVRTYLVEVGSATSATTAITEQTIENPSSTVVQCPDSMITISPGP